VICEHHEQARPLFFEIWNIPASPAVSFLFVTRETTNPPDHEPPLCANPFRLRRYHLKRTARTENTSFISDKYHISEHIDTINANVLPNPKKLFVSCSKTVISLCADKTKGHPSIRRNGPLPVMANRG
jgi:hypothetical protein